MASHQPSSRLSWAITRSPTAMACQLAGRFVVSSPGTTKGGEAPLVDARSSRVDRCSGARASLGRGFCIEMLLIRALQNVHIRDAHYRNISLYMHDCQPPLNTCSLVPRHFIASAE